MTKTLPDRLLLCLRSLLLALFILVGLMTDNAFADSMAIEWLEFNVPVQEQAQFIKQDRLIWDKFLSQYPAFLGKEIWQGIDRPDRLVIVARWASYEQWKAIPPDRIKQTTDLFHQSLGKVYPIVNSHAFRPN